MGPTSTRADDLPPVLDVDLYRATYPDLRTLDDAALRDHWARYGVGEGRIGSAASTRDGFLAALASAPSVLEIGPLANPVVRGPHVRYFDVLPTEGIRDKARAHGLDVDGCPDIDYHSDTADLGVIPDRFAAVVSSHAVEHQPDLVAHLGAVAGLLEPGGRYFLIVPDHRYCFDHFLPASTVADVLGAHLRAATVHDPANVIDTFALGTHNDPHRHWAGDHGQPAYRDDLELLARACEHHELYAGAYVDTHAWQFTPSSFEEITTVLYDLGRSSLRPVRVHPTVRGSLEFYAVLELA